MTDYRPLPSGRLQRIARLAGLGIRASARKVVGGDEPSALRHTAEVLGTLRGLATKIGQMASYVDGFMPGDKSELYETMLGALRSSTPVSSPAAIRAIVEQDLGAPLETLFAEWEQEPIASASLGQVHRAMLPGGRVVAVKVQHPGVARAFDGDLDNLALLEAMIRPLAGRRLDSKSIVSTLCSRLREELDYEIEASHQNYFRAVHRGDPTIRIPELIPDRCSRRVLTSDFVTGITLAEAAQQGESLRRSYAETLWRFVFKGNFVGKAFNADPHPGNYIFQPAGKVVFIDFGCVQPLTPHMFQLGLAQYQSALCGDERGFERATAGFYASEQAPLHEHTRHCFEPLFSSPFRITRQYAANLLRESGALPGKMRGRSDAPPELPLFNRLQFGFYSVLARLDVAVDYARVSREVLAAEQGASLVDPSLRSSSDSPA